MAIEKSHVETLANSAAEVITQNPALQKRMETLVDLVIGQAIRTMNLGSVAQKEALMKSLIPAMLRSMAAVEANQDAKREQEAYDSIRRALGGEVR